MEYQRLIRLAAETPWAILPSKLTEIRAFLSRKGAGDEISAEEIAALTRPSTAPAAGFQRVGSVAVVPVLGTIAHRMNMFSEISGGTSTNKLGNTLRELAEDPQVTAIVLDINSPGGSATGVPELSDLLLELREKKKIVAVANGTAASAAYWIGAACSELVVTPSGQVGSVGVFMMHQDVSKALEAEGVKTTFVHAGKYKVEGNQFEPLSETARASMQESVDAYYEMFVKAVADGRKTTPARVRSDFGQGRMLMAKKALEAGMVDRIASMDATLSRLLARAAARTGGGARATTIRDFETFLRDVGGYTNSEAKRIASSGFGAEGPRDEGVQAQEHVDEQELKRSLEDLAQSLRS
jgi:capsid assembly protease